MDVLVWMETNDDVDDDWKAFVLGAFLALSRRSMVESTLFWLYYLGIVAKVLFIITQAFTLYK